MKNVTMRVVICLSVMLFGAAYVGTNRAAVGAVASAVKSASKAGAQAAQMAKRMGKVAVSAARIAARAGRQLAVVAGRKLSRFGLRLFKKVTTGAPKYAKLVKLKLKFAGEQGRKVLAEVGTKLDDFKVVRAAKGLKGTATKAGDVGRATKTIDRIDDVWDAAEMGVGLYGAATGAAPATERVWGYRAPTTEVQALEQAVQLPAGPVTGGLDVKKEAPKRDAAPPASQAGVVARDMAALPQVPVALGEGLVYDPSRGNRVFDVQTGEDAGVIFVDGQILSPDQTQLYVPHADALYPLPQDTKPVPGLAGFVYHPGWDGEIYDPSTGAYTQRVYRDRKIMTADGSQVFDVQTGQWRPATQQ